MFDDHDTLVSKNCIQNPEWSWDSFMLDMEKTNVRYHVKEYNAYEANNAEFM